MIYVLAGSLYEFEVLVNTSPYVQYLTPNDIKYIDGVERLQATVDWTNIKLWALPKFREHPNYSDISDELFSYHRDIPIRHIPLGLP